MALTKVAWSENNGKLYPLDAVDAAGDDAIGYVVYEVPDPVTLTLAAIFEAADGSILEALLLSGQARRVDG